ncbi:hypothetical protein cyc_07849 [Cyclospora cayetanensis]|uniref:UFSP1/2/DUB catalytic domain-containing protein n=1 Tax=Cyclospora cayetanensis TaxID=88456 RepID=A0A1D3CZA2_9EIME|nr:hypothetical protein cyc_07849 [Cyclospora cayetanensis]
MKRRGAASREAQALSQTDPVPTHWDIQKLLKDNDDAFSDLQVGSPRWIGTIEAQYVLNWYLEFGCRVIYLQHMEEIEAYMGLLLAHFARQQTPVIMGVGQFAYLLLGVAQDLDTLSLRLVLQQPSKVCVCVGITRGTSLFVEWGRTPVHHCLSWNFFVSRLQSLSSVRALSRCFSLVVEGCLRLTGDVQYLIMDPHYVGPEDAKLIDFLERAAAGSFVNLLLPHTSTEDGRLVF